MKSGNVMAALAAGWLAGTVGWAQNEAQPAAAPAVKSAEEAGWTLVFSDTFDRSELGPDWRVVEGDWQVTNGYLRGSGLLLSARGFPSDVPPGFQRLEFEAVTDVQPIIFFPNKPKPKVSVGDMDGLIHAQPPEKNKATLKSGYFFQFGGQNNTLTQLTRAGNSLASTEDAAHLIVPDRKHQVIVENDKGTLRCIVDGKTILEAQEKQSIMGPDYDRVGFYFYTAAKVFDVKVYVKRLPNDLDLD